MAQRLVILGAGGRGRAVIELVRGIGGLEIVGMVDARPSAGPVLGLPVLGTEATLPMLLRDGVRLACIAIGDNAARQAAAARLEALGFTLPALVHPSAIRAGSAVVEAGARW